MSAASSVALLVAFWRPQMVLGLTIDVAADRTGRGAAAVVERRELLDGARPVLDRGSTGGLQGGGMTTHTTPPPTADRRRRLARLTGIAYLGIITTGIFAEFAVRGSLVVADDPTATARNIADAPGIFALGIGADVVMIVLDVVVAVGLFRLLRSVDRRLALAATTLRLVQGAVIAVGLLSLVDALRLATDAVGADGAVLAGPARAALDAVEHHALVYDAGLIAFGLCCLVLGRLLWSTRLVSRPLAAGMAATGVVYLTGSLAALLAPSLSAAIDPFYLVAIVVEPAFALRLITRGLDRPTPASARPVPVAA